MHSSVVIEDSFLPSYVIGKLIGSGRFSKIVRAKHRITEEHVAIKVVSKNNLCSSEISQLSREILCLKLMKHPHIVRLYEFSESSTKMYLVLEVGQGDLSSYIKSNYRKQPMPEREACSFFSQILSAVSFCHKNHIFHRDIKPENVIMFNDFQLVKLADFGLSGINENTSDQACGSIDYAAPEVLLCSPSDHATSDIWGLGVLLYVMVTSERPFQHANKSETMIKIIDCTYELPSHLSESCKRLIEGMVVKDPLKRTSLEQIYCSRWFHEHPNEDVAKLWRYPTTTTISHHLHSKVVDHMIRSGVATYEEITRSLSSESYDYVSSCYHLLSESFVKKAFDLDFPVGLKVNHELLKLSRQDLEGARSDVASQENTNDGGDVSDGDGANLRKSMTEINKCLDEFPYFKSVSKKSRFTRVESSPSGLSLPTIRPRQVRECRKKELTSTSSLRFIKQMSGLNAASANNIRTHSITYSTLECISEDPIREVPVKPLSTDDIYTLSHQTPHINSLSLNSISPDPTPSSIGSPCPFSTLLPHDDGSSDFDKAVREAGNV